MGCNCKHAEDLKKIKPFNLQQEKKGKLFIINEFLINVINKLIMTILLLVLTPIVIVMLLFNYLFKDKLTLILPNFMGKYLQKQKEEDE